jgi:hypothetical protein
MGIGHSLGVMRLALLPFVVWTGNAETEKAALPEVGVTFKTDDAFLQKLYDAADQTERGNIQPFMAGRDALIEGGGYLAVWAETQPMGGAMYALHNLEVALNNQLIFMDCQRADGRIPGMVVSTALSKKNGLDKDTSRLAPGQVYLTNLNVTASFGHFQGYCFPTPALDVYYLIGRDPAYLERLYKVLEASDAYLWRTRDSNGDGVLELWCGFDNGEDHSVRNFDAPDYWSFDDPPTAEHLPKPEGANLGRWWPCLMRQHRKGLDLDRPKLENVRMPYQSMDVMAWSYEGRRVLAEISAELNNGRESYWRQKADEVQKRLIASLWRPEKSACYDRDKNGQFMDILLHNNLRCMWYRVFTQEMADAFVREHLLNPSEFWTPMPLPSIAANDPMFRNTPDNNWSGQPQGLTYQRAIRALENYGHCAEVSLIGATFLRAVGQTCRFRQQYDPFTGAPDDVPHAKADYGPTALAVLGYIAHMHGIDVVRDRVLWSGLPRDGHVLETAVRWGSRLYALKIAGGQMVGSLNGRERFRCTAGVRVVTDAAGTPLQLVGIAPQTQSVALTIGTATHTCEVDPNTVWTVRPNAAPTLSRRAPFDWPYRPSAFTDAVWIGPAALDGPGAAVNAYTAFRKRIDFRSPPTSAVVRVTADSRYLLWVNGTFVGRGPARCFPRHQSYDDYDMAPFLRTGTNWLAVLVHHYGTGNAVSICTSRAGLLAEGAARFASGETLPIRTDASWEVRGADWFGGWRDAVNRKFVFGGSFGFQEWFDARLEPCGWRSGQGRAGWRPAATVAKADGGAWGGYEPRGLKPMREALLPVKGPMAAFTGANATNVLTAEDLGLLWQQEKLHPLPTVPKTGPDGWVAVEPPPDGFVALTFDLGWDPAAFARIEVRGAKGGEILDSGYGCSMNGEDKTPAVSKNSNDRFIAVAGTNEWQSFSLRGYRFHTVKVRAAHPVGLRVTALGAHHDVNRLGAFECSDAGLNQAWEVSDRTLRAGMLDAFVDNNCREQSQWLHDGCVSALGAWATYGDTGLWRRLLRQTGQSSEQYSDGAVNSTVVAGSLWRLSDYTAVWLASLEQYYAVTGDADTLREMLPYVRGLAMRFTDSGLTADGLFLYPPNAISFLDWTARPWDKRPYNLTLNLLVLRGLRSAGRIAEAVGDQELAGYCRRRDREMTGAVVSRFWSAEQRGWREHAEPSEAVTADVIGKRPSEWLNDIFPNHTLRNPKNLEATVCTRHGNALAVLLQLGTPEQQADAAALVARAFDPQEKAINNGMSPLWTDKIFGALFEGGRDSDAVRLLRGTYGTWAKNGALHWGEGFGPGAYSQTCGSSVNWLLTSYLLGIRPTRAGFAEAVFDPRPGDLRWARGTVVTPHGAIEVSWKREGNGALVGSVRAPSRITVKSRIPITRVER